MLDSRVIEGRRLPLAEVIASRILISRLAAHWAPQPAQLASGVAAYRSQPPRIANREAAFYEEVRGTESPRVKAVGSDVILQFS